MGVAARTSSPQARAFLPALKRDAAAALQILGLNDRELSLLLCDDATIQCLNRDYRFVDKPTDVLSFPQEDEADGKARRRSRHAFPSAPGKRGGREAPALPELPLLGDIVISLPTAERQAQALGQSPPERLRTLMIHGLFHLIGYDHERSSAEARRMFGREREMGAALDERDKPPGGRRAKRTAHPAAANTPVTRELIGGASDSRPSNSDGGANRATNRGR